MPWKSSEFESISGEALLTKSQTIIVYRPNLYILEKVRKTLFQKMTILRALVMQILMLNFENTIQK